MAPSRLHAHLHVDGRRYLPTVVCVPGARAAASPEGGAQRATEGLDSGERPCLNPIRLHCGVEEDDPPAQEVGHHKAFVVARGDTNGGGGKRRGRGDGRGREQRREGGRVGG